MDKLAVVAIGGNSLIKDKNHQTVPDQYAAICETVVHIVDLVEKGYNVVISHGNGPQVGFILRRSEIAEEAGMHPVPLVSCGADTQGAIGYQIQQAMDNEFRKRKLYNKFETESNKRKNLKTAITVVTQVVVDKNDSAFKNPTKPIGSFYSGEEYERIKKHYPEWQMVSDAGRGYRRVVASPKPAKILELEAIELLLKADFCVVAVGGGGIPVYKNEHDEWEGVDAVIDKDFASSLLASDLKADLLIISTGVEKVYLNYGKPDQKALDRISVTEAKKYVAEKHFAAGSMLPKIEAAITFIENGGKEALITDPEHLGLAVDGKTGTRIVP